MKCNHCGNEWTIVASSKNENKEVKSCPFCGKILNFNQTSDANMSRGRFEIVNNVLVQFLGGTKQVVIPNGVTKIGAGAFRGYDIESVQIPESVTEMGNNCFKDCVNLKHINIPDSVVKIGETTFKGVEGVKMQVNKGSFAWNFYKNCGELKKIEVPRIEGAAATSNNEDVRQKKVTNIERTKDKSLTKTVQISQATTNMTPPYASVTKKVESVDSNKKTNVKALERADNTQKVEDVEKLMADLLKTISNDAESIDNTRTGQLVYTSSYDVDWRVKNNFLGKADRVVKKIKQIHDQRFLMRVAQEAPLLRVRCAAIENITSQEILKKYAMDKEQSVRLAAINNLQDQEALKKLAVSDTSEYVRALAISKIRDEKTIKQFLIKATGRIDSTLISKITQKQDLYDLAILSSSTTVRELAAKSLPQTESEIRLLVFAAKLSWKITAVDLRNFNKAYDKLVHDNPKFLEKIAANYPDSGVRYLARGKTGLPSKEGTTVEARLRSYTPTEEEMKKRREITRCQFVISNVESFVRDFSQKCNSLACSGGHRAESVYPEYSWRYIENYEEAVEFERLVEVVLKEKGFSNAVVRRESEYSSYDQKFLGYKILVYTSW